MRRRRTLIALVTGGALMIGGPALACGGLVAPNGAVQLLRTSTLAAYHDGVEHYVTSFEFAGAKGEFGSIVPLPGVPTKVQQGGDWTLQRLLIEVQPVFPEEAPLALAAADAERSATVILEKKVGALDIVILEGGAREVVSWAEQNGFALSDDAPDVLGFYARRSPIFMAAKYDATRAARLGLNSGDGTPIHLTIPTDNPWVPLHILSLGKPDDEIVEADLFLLTDRTPAILPAPAISDDPTTPGLSLVRRQEASEALLADLRSDRGMKWMPQSGMQLTYLALNVPAADLTYDLAVDASGLGHPDPADTGAVPSAPLTEPGRGVHPIWVAAGLLAALGLVAVFEARKSLRARPS